MSRRGITHAEGPAALGEASGPPAQRDRSTSHRTASSRGYWSEGLSYLWPGKEGGKCAVSLFSFSSLPQEERSERKP